MNAVSGNRYPNGRAGYADPVAGLMPWLGSRTVIGMNGLVQFNEPLVNRIVRYGADAVPAMYRFLSTVQYVPALLEGLYTAQRLAQAGIKEAAGLYPAVSRWNTNPDPLIQIYLSGFYRHINIPTTFGPMLSTLINQSVNRYPLQSSPTYNITEEVGGTVLQQIAEHTANETVRRLLPYLNLNNRASSS